MSKLGLICTSQPLIDIRLLAYSSVQQTKTYKVWADPVSLATTPGIIGYFLFLSLLRCFSSGAYLLSNPIYSD